MIRYQDRYLYTPIIYVLKLAILIKKNDFCVLFKPTYYMITNTYIQLKLKHMKKNKISYRCNLNNNHYKTKVPQHKSESIYICI